MKTSNNTIQRIYKAELCNEFEDIIGKLKLNINTNYKLQKRNRDESYSHWIQIASECYQETFQSPVNSLNFSKEKLKKECKNSKITVDTFSKILTAVNTIANLKKKSNILKNPTFRVEIVTNNVKNPTN